MGIYIHGGFLNVINVGYPLEDIAFKCEIVRLSNAILSFFNIQSLKSLGNGLHFLWNYEYSKSDNRIHE